MATTKTFKTRIKLKYDLQSAWESTSNPFSALRGELLLGKNNDAAEKVFANVGVENGAIKPLSILTNNVLIESVNEGVTSYQTLTAKLGEIDAVLGEGGSVEDQITAAINALNAGPLQLASVDAGGITIKQIKEEKGKISIDETSPIVINIADAYDAEGNKIATVATVENAVTAAQDALEGQIETLEGTVEGHGTAISGLQGTVGEHDTRLSTVEGVAGSALQSISAADSTGSGASFVTTTVGEKDSDKNQAVGVSVTTHDIATASDESNGLATALGVKNYVEDYVETELTGIVGAMVYKGTVNSSEDLPEASEEGVQEGWTYIVSTAGTYNGQSCEIGDMIIVQSVENGTITFNIVNGENQVTAYAEGALITAGGGAVTVATVDGTDIKVKVQVTGGAATIASVDNNSIVTLNTGVTQGDGTGTIASTSETIELAKVAKTGAAADVSYNNTTTVADAIAANTQAITANKTAITTLNSDENTPGSVAHSINTAINTTIAELDSEVTAGTDTVNSVPAADFKVLQKIAIEDGKLVPSASAHVGLKKLAATANVNDLIQEATDCIIFDCGSASLVINTEE